MLWSACKGCALYNIYVNSENSLSQIGSPRHRFHFEQLKVEVVVNKKGETPLRWHSTEDE